jgi:hypothetical protein
VSERLQVERKSNQYSNTQPNEEDTLCILIWCLLLVLPVPHPSTTWRDSQQPPSVLECVECARLTASCKILTIMTARRISQQTPQHLAPCFSFSWEATGGGAIIVVVVVVDVVPVGTAGVATASASALSTVTSCFSIVMLSMRISVE